ncbi:MAG: NAD(P)-dependent oxidoreductase [Chloroflexi bacterium]|nr:NAD(P)-dependent oxidoreductase [Chloroflexota bacterium]
MAKKTVLLTGASGYVASQLLAEFQDRYDLRMVDVKTTDRDGNDVPGIQVADLIDSDRTKYAELFDGVDAVIHLGYKRSGGFTGDEAIDRFDIEFENVQMANNIYRSSYDAGVRRVVMASSNHAADWYEHAMIHNKQKEMVSPTEVPVSDNFYGWAKASYELLGFPYATGIFGRKLEVVQIRIGAPREVPGSRYETDDLTKLSEQHTGGSGLTNFKRDLGAHLSARDLRQLIMKSIETPNIERPDGVPWQVVYGISGNTRAFWSLESARAALGYDPEDDSEVKYAGDISRLLTSKDAGIGGGKVGG